MGGTPPPFTENSAKIINLIYEPFPYYIEGKKAELKNQRSFLIRNCTFFVFVFIHEQPYHNLLTRTRIYLNATITCKQLCQYLKKSLRYWDLKIWVLQDFHISELALLLCRLKIV